MAEPLLVTCALIESDEKILVALRPVGKALGGKWEFPGGKLELNETPEKCLKREIWEELECEISITSALTPVDHKYSNFVIRLIPFACVIHSGNPTPLEHDAIKWCEPSSLLEIDLADADIPVAVEFLDRKERANYGNTPRRDL